MSDLHKDTLINLLGLDAKASDEDISNAAATFQADMVTFKTDLEQANEKLANDATAAEGRATAAETKAETLSNANKAMVEELAANDLIVFKDVINNADEVKAALISNRAGTIAVLKNIKQTEKAAPAAPLHNAKTAGQPGPVTQPEQAPYSKEDAIRISNRAREIAKTLNMSHQQAFIAAKGELAKQSTATK